MSNREEYNAILEIINPEDYPDTENFAAMILNLLIPVIVLLSQEFTKES